MSKSRFYLHDVTVTGSFLWGSILPRYPLYHFSGNLASTRVLLETLMEERLLLGGL